ncbi:MAG: flagellar filament capping protein FliD [Huintestinicola sp.]
MSSVSDITRMSGLVSGLDTESLIKAATANTKNSINTRKQKLQTLTWKQEAYRNIISTLSNFQDKYLKITSPNSIRANAVMKANKAESSDESLSVAASSAAVAGKYSITSVKQASAAKLEGTKASAGTVELDFSNADAGSNTVKVTLDGTTKNITFEGGANAKDNFLTALNDSFSGISAAKFSFKDGTDKLTIENAADDKVSHVFTVGYSNAVGLQNDASNRLSTTSKLGSVDFAQELRGNEFSITINGTDFSFDRDTTIKDMMNTINKSDAGVQISFDTLKQSFSIQSKETGAGKEVDISQSSGNLLNSLFNIGSDQLGTEPTIARGISDKTVFDTDEFVFTASATGFASDDKLVINGKELTVELRQKQATEKIKLDENSDEIDAKLYKNADGDVYAYAQDGGTAYSKKNDDGTFTELMFVAKDGTVKINGVDVDKTADEQMEELGIEKKYKEYTNDEYAAALNAAYKSSFPEGNGTFSVTSADGTASITFKPAADEAVSASASGSISLAPTGHTDLDGNVSNFTETYYTSDRTFAYEETLKFTDENGNEVTITGSDGKVTFQDLKDSGYFNYDESTGTLSVTGNHVLTAANSAAETAATTFFGRTELVGEGNVGGMKFHGSNAQMTINGVTLESTTNAFSVEGSTFNIGDVKEFDENDIAAGTAEEITVNISKDTSKIKDTIKEFIEAYNLLLDTVHKELDTSRPKESGEYFDPLTEEQEEEMEQDEIDKWNEKAKQGLLYHDSTLTRVFNELRNAISGAAVDGKSLLSMGIDTESDIDEYGKLKIDDESKLDAALEEYGDDIAKFFTDSENGLAIRLNNAVNSAIDTSTTSRGFPKGILTSVAGVKDTRSETKNTLYSQISSLQDIIEKMQERYENQQNTLWSRYSTLETYISNMNNQSMSLFGTSLTGSSS